MGKTPESWNSSVFSIILTLSKNVVVPIAGLVIAAMVKIHQYFMLCAPTASQHAGEEALRHELDTDFAQVNKMVSDFT